MKSKAAAPHAYEQYGLKDDKARTNSVDVESPASEVPGFGPADAVDAVDAGGHRLGTTENPQAQKQSPRAVQARIQKSDGKAR